MKTLTLYYAKSMHYVGEETEYKTWHWIDGEWQKVSVPNFISSETKEAEEWFKINNREDLIFLEKEIMACQYWYDDEKKEISTAQEILR